MATAAIVKDLDEFKDRLAGLVPGLEVAAMVQFVFEGAPEGLHGGIVVAIAFATHRRRFVGWGRDYRVMSPVRGVILGGGKHKLAVQVDVVPT